MKFKFRLEKILDFKKVELQILKKDFQELNLLFQNESNKLKNLIDERSTSFQFRKNKISESKNNYAIYVEEFVSGQDIRIERQKEYIKSILHKVENSRNLLLEKEREIKILEKVKENKKNEYIKEMSDLETKEIDDLISARFLKKGLSFE